jgi:hypothetical protein
MWHAYMLREFSELFFNGEGDVAYLNVEKIYH